jgi:hypothetical protein
MSLIKLLPTRQVNLLRDYGLAESIDDITEVMNSRPPTALTQLRGITINTVCKLIRYMRERKIHYLQSYDTLYNQYTTSRKGREWLRNLEAREIKEAQKLKAPKPTPTPGPETLPVKIEKIEPEPETEITPPNLLEVENARLLYQAFIETSPRDPVQACELNGIRVANKNAAWAKIELARKVLVQNIDVLNYAIGVLYDNLHAVKISQIYNTSEKKRVPVEEPDYVARNAAAREIARVQVTVEKIKAEKKANVSPFDQKVPNTIEEAREMLVQDTIRQLNGCNWSLKELVGALSKVG